MADPFSVTGSAVGVISLGLTVFSGLLQYYGSWKDSEREIAATYSSTEELTKTLMLIRDTLEGQSFRRSIVDRVTESLDSCSAGVQSLEKKLAKIRATTPYKPGEKIRAHARKAAYPFKKSTLIKLGELVSDLRDSLSLAVDALQLDVSASSLRKLEDISFRLATLVEQSQSTSTDIAKGIAEVRLTQEEHDTRFMNQEKLAIIAWLSPLNFIVRQNDVFSRRQEGAGNWLLQSDQFQMWLSGKFNLLWCPGMPGAGKTVLTSVIVDYLQQRAEQDGLGIGYVYCIYNAIDQTAINLIASLLQQLVQQQSVLSGDIESLYNHHSGLRTRPSLREYTRLLRSHIDRFPNVFIVVDALDECSEHDGVRDTFLAQLRSLLPNVRLLVTSRHIASLDQAFDDSTHLEIRANDEDVATYLQLRIEEQALLRGHIKDDPILKDTIIDTIIDKANGMFLLAELHLNSLVNQDNRRGLRRALQTLPKELDKTYDNTIIRIESQDHQKVERARQVLSWMSFAERPLTIREMQYALAVEPEDTDLDEEALPNENALLSVCCGLVVVEQESNIVRFVHFTTETYIEHVRQTQYPSAQRMLSEACLTYLSLKVFACGACANYELETRIRVNPLLEYAAQHWGNHARKALEQGLNIDKMIVEFLRIKGNVGSSVQVADHFEQLPIPILLTGSYADISDLHVAAGFGLEKFARMFIEQGADPNARDYHGCTPLHKAAAKGRDAIVRLLLEKGANLRAKSQGGATALHWAAHGGHETVLQTLFENGLEVELAPFQGLPNWYYDFGLTSDNRHIQIIHLLLKQVNDDAYSGMFLGRLLQRACSAMEERLVIFLLAEGEGLKGFNVWIDSSISYAACLNDTSVMKLLLGAGGDVNSDMRKPLHAAAGSGSVAAMQLLLENGAIIESVDSDGDRPLHKAVQNGQDKIITLLLNKGADLEAAAGNGETALITAVRGGHKTVVRQLLDRSADISMKDRRSGRSALQWAVIGGRETMVQLLLRYYGTKGLTENILKMTSLYRAIDIDEEIRIQQVLSDKQTLQSEDLREFFSLHAAAGHGYESVLEAFLEDGVEVDAKGENSETALHRAASRGQIATTRWLLKKGANIEAKGSGSQTALKLAARYGYTDVVKLLLERGADIESSGRDPTYGGTALLQAAMYGHVETMRLLLQAGANPNALDDTPDNKSLLHRAATGMRSDEVVKILIASGANLEAKNSMGETALVEVVQMGRAPRVQLLLEGGADPNAVQATVTPRYNRDYEVYFEQALAIVLEAQKTWRGREAIWKKIEGSFN